MKLFLLLSLAFANPRDEFIEFEKSRDAYLIQDLENLKDKTEYSKEAFEEKGQEIPNINQGSEIQPPTDQIFMPQQGSPSMTKEQAQELGRRLLDQRKKP